MEKDNNTVHNTDHIGVFLFVCFLFVFSKRAHSRRGGPGKKKKKKKELTAGLLLLNLMVNKALALTRAMGLTAVGALQRTR